MVRGCPPGMGYYGLTNNIDEAVRNAGRYFKEARVDAVKPKGELSRLLAALKK